MIEAIQSIAFSLTIKTERREIVKTGTSYRELADALDDLYEEDLCPFPVDMDEDDPEWWDYDDEFEEIADTTPETHTPPQPGHED